MDKKSQINQRLYTIEDLECMLEHIPHEVWLKDKDGKYVYINKRGANKIGLDKKDIIGKSDKEIRPKEFSDKCDDADKIVLEEKRALFYEHEYYSDEDEFYRVYKFPITDENKNVKFISGFSNEYSYSKKINEELENLFISNMEELEHVEYTQSIYKILNNLGSMIKSTSISLFLLDKNCDNLKNYLSCNKNNIFCENVKIPIDHNVFSKLYRDKLDINVGDDLNLIFKKNYIEGSKIESQSKLKIFPLRCKEDFIGLMYVYYENDAKYTNVYDEVINDLCIQISRLIINIEFKNKLRHRLIKFEERAKYLQSENEKLEEAIDAEMIKVNFLENMSHEFRTPINIILMTAKLLISSMEDNEINLDREKTIKYLKTLRQNGYRVLRLVNNILDTTKIDNKYEKLQMTNHNIVNVIEDIVLSTADYIKNKNKSITFDTEEEEIVLACNPDAMEKIILNLISNSLKFTGEDGQIEIDIKVNHEESKLFVHLRNNGPSISQEDSKKIFNRFVQVDNHLRRSSEGSGIGLYLVKSLVEMHDGEIWLNTEVESGVEFIFYIPIKTIYSEEVMVHSIEDHSKIDKCNIEFSDVYSI
ncbi:sensor histidine kinase [Terrisporobacter vanillatitrophus]|uniref:sensor histidine kinase n=1 Tax=Terrisporobacter vanillatitrophus TaxID=3058402 RepID=UPI0033694F1E